jgi:hypothetical protein
MAVRSLGGLCFREQFLLPAEGGDMPDFHFLVSFFFFFCPRLLKGYGVFKLFFTFVHLHWWDVTVYGKFSFTSTGMAAISFGHLQRTWGLEKLLHCFQELFAPAFS